MIWKKLIMQYCLTMENSMKDWIFSKNTISKYHISKPILFVMWKNMLWFTISITRKINMQKNIFYTTDNIAYFLPAYGLTAQKTPKEWIFLILSRRISHEITWMFI